MGSDVLAGRRLQSVVRSKKLVPMAIRHRISLAVFTRATCYRETEAGLPKPVVAVYMGVNDIPLSRQGLGVSIVSTPMGVMSGSNARKPQMWRRKCLHRILRRTKMSFVW